MSNSLVAVKIWEKERFRKFIFALWEFYGGLAPGSAI